jgi:hypothetical protein
VEVLVGIAFGILGAMSLLLKIKTKWFPNNN